MGSKTQREFHLFTFDSTGLNLHRQTTPVDDLVVFIHGLNGSGDSTWGHLPAFVFDHYGSADVAIFNYATAAKRFRKASVDRKKLRFHVNQLAIHLQRLKQYERIHLVGHSLGGVVADLVAMRIVEDHFALKNDPLCELASITYFASPRLGSGAAAAALQWLLPEFRILKRLSGPSSEIDRVFTKRLETDLEKDVQRGAVRVPRFACIGGHDSFVKAFSTTVGIPEGQCFPLQETHSSISKPATFEAPQFTWLLECISKVSQVRQQTRELQSRRERDARKAAADPSTLVAEYWGVVSGEWEEIFHEARRASSTAEVSLEDKREVDAHLPTDLIVSVSHAREVVAQEETPRQYASETFARIRDEHQLTAGLAAVGVEWKDAATVLNQWIGDSGTRRVSAGGAAHSDELKLLLAGWMRTIVKRRTLRIEALHGRGMRDTVVTTGNEVVGEVP